MPSMNIIRSVYFSAGFSYQDSNKSGYGSNFKVESVFTINMSNLEAALEAQSSLEIHQNMDKLSVVLEENLKKISLDWDHQYLNSLEDFKNKVCTPEVMTQILFEKLENNLSQNKDFNEFKTKHKDQLLKFALSSLNLHFGEQKIYSYLSETSKSSISKINA